MTAFNVRPATLADAPQLAHLYRRAYESAATLGYPSRMTDIDAETVSDWLEREATTLVALEQASTQANPKQERDPETVPAPDPDEPGPIIGTVRLLYEREEPYLERLAVDPSYQGSGLGGDLVDRIEDVARGQDASCIQLTTFDGHPFLLEWYERRGYDPITYHEYEDRPYDFVTMEKSLETDW